MSQSITISSLLGAFTGATAGTCARGSGLGTIPIVMALLGLNLLSRQALADEIDDQNQHHQDQSSRPCEFDLVLERHYGEVIDEHRKRCRGLHEIEMTTAGDPVVAEQGRKQERRSFTGGTGDRQHDPRKYSRHCRRQKNHPRGLRARGPHPDGSFLHLRGHHGNRILGGENDGRQHENRECNSPRNSRIASGYKNDGTIGEYSRQDGGKPGKYLGRKSHRRSKSALAGGLRQVHAGENSQWHGDERGDSYHDEGADDGVAEAASLFQRSRRQMREYSQAELLPASPDQHP